MKKYFYLLSSLLLLGACSASDGPPVDIPDVRLSCDTAKCGLTGSRTAVTIITRSGCAPDQVELDPVAVGTSNATCTGGACTATISSWVDNNNATVTTIPSNTYYVCSRIDIDNGITSNAADEFSEMNIGITNSSTIDADEDTWGVTYTFSRAKQQ